MKVSCIGVELADRRFGNRSVGLPLIELEDRPERNRTEVPVSLRLSQRVTIDDFSVYQTVIVSEWSRSELEDATLFKLSFELFPCSSFCVVSFVDEEMRTQLRDVSLTFRRQLSCNLTRSHDDITRGEKSCQPLNGRDVVFKEADNGELRIFGEDSAATRLEQPQRQKFLRDLSTQRICWDYHYDPLTWSRSQNTQHGLRFSRAGGQDHRRDLTAGRPMCVYRVKSAGLWRPKAYNVGGPVLENILECASP